MSIYGDVFESPLGPLWIKADQTHILAVLYDRAEDPVGPPNSVTEMCKKQLMEYFDGERSGFDVPFKLLGTPFQESVWRALLEVPFGKTATYGAQAQRLKKPKAVRAVGAANGKNKINIIVPCHRVIGSTGSLTGYGGGLERKKWLLDHEIKVAKGLEGIPCHDT